MHTYEMIGVADSNGRTYKCPYGTYSKATGFVSNGYEMYISLDVVNKLFHEDCWSLKQETKKMSKEDIEKELGYEIEIINENNIGEIDKIKNCNSQEINKSNMNLSYMIDDLFRKVLMED